MDGAQAFYVSKLGESGYFEENLYRVIQVSNVVFILHALRGRPRKHSMCPNHVKSGYSEAQLYIFCSQQGLHSKCQGDNWDTFQLVSLGKLRMHVFAMSVNTCICHVRPGVFFFSIVESQNGILSSSPTL